MQSCRVFSLLPRFFAASALVLFSLVPAYSATPSDAFQRAEHLGQMVEVLLESDLYEKQLEADPAKSPSKPRHVLRYAKRVFDEIQFLRALNGAAPQNAPEIDATEIKPADVVLILEAAISSLRELEGIYQVDLNFTPPAKAEGKKPADVMARLRAVRKSLVKLGTPTLLPNDVYRLALSIKNQSEKLVAQRGVSGVGSADKVKKASPADALKEVLKLFDDLDHVSKSGSEFALPGGVIKPPVPAAGAPVTPTDVFVAVQYALADIYSLNVKLGDKKPLQLPSPQSGRNPADVKNVLAQARLNIQALSQK